MYSSALNTQTSQKVLDLSAKRMPFFQVGLMDPRWAQDREF